MSLLEHLISDSKAMEAEAKEGEKAAQEDYEVRSCIEEVSSFVRTWIQQPFECTNAMIEMARLMR